MAKAKAKGRKLAVKAKAPAKAAKKKAAVATALTAVKVGSIGDNVRAALKAAAPADEKTKAVVLGCALRLGDVIISDASANFGCSTVNRWTQAFFHALGRRSRWSKHIPHGTVRTPNVPVLYKLMTMLAVDLDDPNEQQSDVENWLGHDKSAIAAVHKILDDLPRPAGLLKPSKKAAVKSVLVSKGSINLDVESPGFRILGATSHYDLVSKGVKLALLDKAGKLITELGKVTSFEANDDGDDWVDYDAMIQEFPTTDPKKKKTTAKPKAKVKK